MTYNRKALNSLISQNAKLYNYSSYEWEPLTEETYFGIMANIKAMKAESATCDLYIPALAESGVEFGVCFHKDGRIDSGSMESLKKIGVA